jgi:hypothetical protein
MVTLEVHPEINIRLQLEHPTYSTCHECRRTFHAKSEDQLSLTLCDVCFEDLRSLREPTISIHVKPRPRHVTTMEAIPLARVVKKKSAGREPALRHPNS